jgi:hypothetical protein
MKMRHQQLDTGRGILIVAINDQFRQRRRTPSSIRAARMRNYSAGPPPHGGSALSFSLPDA